jgi:hypothetical protein
MKKPRSDSKLDALDMDQQRQLCEWLLTPGLNYERVKELVFEKFNVSTSGAALSKFYQSYVGSYVLERRRQAVGLATEIGAELKRAPGEFSAQTIDALEQKAFELAQNPMVDPREVKAIFSLVLKARDQSLKERDIEIKLRRLELLETNAESAKAKLTDAIAKSGSSISKDTLRTLEEAAKLL